MNICPSNPDCRNPDCQGECTPNSSIFDRQDDDRNDDPDCPEGCVHKPPDRMTSDEIKETVSGIINGDIYCAQWVPKELLGMVFMSLSLMGHIRIDGDYVGEIIAYKKYALSQGINGYPIFLGHRFVHKDDWDIIVERHNEVRAAMSKAMEGL